MTPADELRRRAKLGQQPVQPLDPGPLSPTQHRNKQARDSWAQRWKLEQIGRNLRRLGRMLRGESEPERDPSEIRDCICGDPENCTQPVPGYRCKAGR